MEMELHVVLLPVAHAEDLVAVDVMGEQVNVVLAILAKTMLVEIY